MLRRSAWRAYYWSRYRLPLAMPKIDGPPPLAAPQSMNNTTASEYIDPIDDKFPKSIRGDLVRPDVPTDQYVDSWYVCTSMTHHLGDYRPWSASAPANAYRFRPYNEFDAKGREYVGQLHAFRRYDAARTRGRGAAGFPFRDAYLATMASSSHLCGSAGNQFHNRTCTSAAAAALTCTSDSKTTAATTTMTHASPQLTAKLPSLETTLDRAVAVRHRHGRVLSPLMVQRDVGRLEAPPSCAGRAPADARAFPFRWQTEDWYEYEVAKARNRRFTFSNTDESGPDGAEVTYRIVLEGQWEHHVVKLADDVCMYVKDVGRHIVAEKLRGTRRLLECLDGATASHTRGSSNDNNNNNNHDDSSRGDDGDGGGAVDPDLVRAFRSARRGVFGGPDRYDVEEVANFLRADLRRLEERCVGVINRCNVPVPAATNLYDAQVSWPYVETLEPWVRMAEFWTSASDVTFTELEMSTVHYEFRKYFRVVVVKMPFQSREFEQRLHGIRHWLHRRTSCELHTTYRHNLVHDAGVYATEADPATPPTHEHHRLFSFALDWQSGPAHYMAVEATRDGDTWAGVAARVGCGVAELRAANPSLAADDDGGGNNENDNDVGARALPAGEWLVVPATATRRLVSFGATPRVLPLVGADGARLYRSWADAAAALDCGVDELQRANGHAAATYRDDAGFAEDVVELLVPPSAWDAARDEEFASHERVYAGDTPATLARRLGCDVAALRAANADVLAGAGDDDDDENDAAALAGVAAVRVPASARTPRRVVHPQLRPQAATDALLTRTAGEQAERGIAALPQLPDHAARFPHEYHTPTSRFPPTPRLLPGTENWMAYTRAYLDKHFALRDEPAPAYNVNRLWPMQQVPGKVDATPFVEDQTWLLSPIPVQQRELHHPEKDLQDLPFINHEQFPRSLEWTAP